MRTNVGFFAGFTSSLAFRYSVIFIVRLKQFQTTPPQLGLSSFLQWSFRDCGCGKAMSFDNLFRKDPPNKMLQITPSRLVAALAHSSVEFAVVMHSTLFQSSLLSPHASCRHLFGTGSVSELCVIRPRICMRHIRRFTSASASRGVSVS